jgi:hypothetical protein
VSTDKQGKSGLGLQAQRKAVLDYLDGGRWSLVQEFVEVESGKMISERTRAALKAAKARGTRLGNPQLAKAAKRGTAAVRANARRFAANVLPIIEEIERAGITSHNAIAAKLNERNVRTARGGKWTHVQVGAVLRPFEGSATGL